MPDNIILIGLSFTGKSTVGRIVARSLGRVFLDTDAMVERRTGRTPQEIFAVEGEEAFRRLERDCVREALDRSRAVISMGGGAVLDVENRQRMRAENLVVLLEAEPATIVQRLRASKSGSRRPLLEVPDPLAAVQSLLEARRPAYAIAHFAVATDNKTPDRVAQEVLEGIRHYERR